MDLGMVALDVRDLQRSIDFYRLLGLEMPDRFPGRPVSLLRMDNGVGLVLAEGYAAANDPSWTRPTSGYQQYLEFFLDSDAAVDELWQKLTAAGHHGRVRPRRTTGPYTGMVDDPDGNVIMITSETGDQPTAPTSSRPAAGGTGGGAEPVP